MVGRSAPASSVGAPPPPSLLTHTHTQKKYILFFRLYDCAVLFLWELGCGPTGRRTAKMGARVAYRHGSSSSLGRKRTEKTNERRHQPSLAISHFESYFISLLKWERFWLRQVFCDGCPVPTLLAAGRYLTDITHTHWSVGRLDNMHAMFQSTKPKSAAFFWHCSMIALSEDRQKRGCVTTK